MMVLRLGLLLVVLLTWRGSSGGRLRGCVGLEGGVAGDILLVEAFLEMRGGLWRDGGHDFEILLTCGCRMGEWM
jgi:hypothetical protein